jgi:D-lactate dehydrogenase (cytochrome)
MLDKKLLKAFAKAVGRRFVLTEPADVLLYSYDSSTARGVPGAVVLPASTEEVAKVVRLCRQHRVPFVPRGAGTNLSGGSVPPRGGVVIGLSRMNAVRAVDLANQRAVVQPGLVNLDLQNRLAPDGFQFCPDPASQKASTIGGNVAENAGGPHCLKYGVTTNHVLGLTVVLPSGEVRPLGSRLLDTPGYDLVGLFVGSEGTFGPATEMILRLRPLAESAQVVLALFDTLESAGAAVSEIIAAGIVATALEIMDRNSIQAVEASFPTGLPTDVEAMLLIEIDGLAEALDRQTERCAAICRKHQARSVEVGRTVEERTKLWTARRSAFGATARLNPTMFTNDSTVPRTRLPEVLRGIQEVERESGLQIAKVFHAGDGNLHCNILYDQTDPEGFHRAERASLGIFQLAAGVGGTITGEHGVGAEKPHHLHLIFSDADIEAMRRLRRVFDPEGLANPGKVLPHPPTPSPLVERGSPTEGRTETRGPLLAPGPRPLAPGGIDLRRFEEIVGEGHLITATGGVATMTEGVSDYAVDGQMPLAVAAPGSEEQVRALLAAAAESKLSVLLRGGGTHLSLGAPAGPIGLALSLRRLDQVVAYDAEDLTITVQAGMTLRALQALVGEHGQLLPLDPPGSEEATIGGVAALNLAGPLRMRYGAPRDLVLGLRVALSSGEVIKTGGRTVKNVAGYDLTKLFVGSLGTVGALLEVTLRLIPSPERRTMMVAAAPAARVKEAVAQVLGSRLDVATCDLADAAATKAMGLPLPVTVAPGAIVMFFGLLGAEESVARQERELKALFLEGAARVDGDTVWSAVRALGAPRPRRPLLRLSVPMAAVVDMMQDVAAQAGWSAAARAGDGTVYAAGPEEDDGAVQTLRSLRAAAAAHGGFAVLVSGSTAVKRAFPVWGEQIANADLMQALKRSYDPAGILGCGRFVVGK